LPGLLNLVMVMATNILHISADSELLLRSFGNETLLFHSASGDTLLLSPIAVPLVTRLQQGPLEKQALFEFVAEELNFELEKSFISHMERVLSGLVKRDIVAIQ